jgi:hypothetical protein
MRPKDEEFRLLARIRFGYVLPTSPVTSLPRPTQTMSPDLTLPPAQLITRGRARTSSHFRQARPVWDRAAEMILLAGTTRKATDVDEATRQLLVALGHENWWKDGAAGQITKARDTPLPE